MINLLLRRAHDPRGKREQAATQFPGYFKGRK
jgi:hypothetical protein